jgi:hypothetical protein
MCRAESDRCPGSMIDSFNDAGYACTKDGVDRSRDVEEEAGAASLRSGESGENIAEDAAPAAEPTAGLRKGDRILGEGDREDPEVVPAINGERPFVNGASSHSASVSASVSASRRCSASLSASTASSSSSESTASSEVDRTTIRGVSAADASRDDTLGEATITLRSDEVRRNARSGE